MKIYEAIDKLQKLPESKKKNILWTIVLILAIIMGFFWIKGVIRNFSKIGQEIQKIELPQIETPKLQMPEPPTFNLEGDIKP